MEICNTVAAMRACTTGLRHGGQTIALVPTMGALHAGHLSLVRLARQHAGRVVASIFVNPAQFEKPEDLAAYPRTLDDDLAQLRAEGVDAVLVPDAAEIYAPGAETVVETTHLANILHGQVRPGHFRGVATVVTKLFNIVQPDVAVFGEKDYQQLQVIRRMVRDLHMPVRILGAPTVRDPDGLALSSRNRRLGPQDRQAALVLNRALDAAEALARTATTAEDLRDVITNIVAAEPGAKLAGLDICAPETLAELAGPLAGPAAIMISALVGPVLLIDQRVVG